MLYPVAGAAVLILALMLSTIASVRPANRMVSALAFGLAFIVWHAPDLTGYPMVADDEVLLNEPARTLAENGSFDSPLLTADHHPMPLVIQPPLQATAVAVVYKIIGFGIWQTRFAGVLWGAIAVALISLIAQTFFPAPHAASLAVMLLMVNPSFAISTRMARMDTLCAAFILAAYYAYLAQARAPDAKMPFVFAGLFVALACLTHPVAISVLIGLTLLVVFPLRRSRYLGIVLFAIGGLVVAALWGLLILRAGPSYLADLVHHGSLRTVSGSLLSRIGAECVRWLREIQGMPLLFACYVAGIVWRTVWPSNRHIASELLMLASVAFVFNALVMSKESGFYTIYPQLFLTMMAAGSMAAAIQRRGRHRQAAVILILLLAVNSLPVLVLPRVVAATVQHDARDYAPIQEQLQATVPDGSTVWSVPEGWYALAEGRSVRTPSLDYNLAPNALVDQFAVVRSAEPLRDPSFTEIGRIGQEVPAWHSRTFATTDYRLIVYRSRLLK